MTQRRLWSGVLVAVLTLSVAEPVRAEDHSLNTAADEIVLAIVVVAAAIGIVAIVLVHHYSATSTITGCVKTETNGMSVTNEKDQRNYALSGSVIGIKPGDRVALKGKRKAAGKTFVFEAQKVTRDFGACQP